MAPRPQHTPTPRTGQPASAQQTFDRDRIGIYHQHWVPSKHQVTTLLLAKAWEGRRAFPGHGHALDPNPRGKPKSHIVVLSDADLPTGGQPRCRSTRFTGSRTVSETSERRAQRAVAVSFFLLAPYIGVESIRDLGGAHEMTPSLLGVAVTAASLVVMPLLGRAKQRLGERLDSGATVGEGMQNYLCAAQAGAVLLGLGATAAFGWSWLDPVIGLLLAGWAVYEGVEAWHGEDCC